MRRTGFTDAWLTALRSGEYRQGQTSLRQTDPATGEHSYCCLGVAAELVHALRHLTADGVHSIVTAEWVSAADSNTDVAVFLPVRLGEAFGVTSAEQGYLANLNDGVRLSFTDIADAIEADLNDEERLVMLCGRLQA